MAIPVDVVVCGMFRLFETVVDSGPGHLAELAGLLQVVVLRVSVILVLVRETVVSGCGGSGAAASLLVAEVQSPDLLGPLAHHLPHVVRLLQPVQPIINAVCGGI